MSCCIQDIDYFVYMNGFYFTNRLYPVEIGFAELKNYQASSLIPVDLLDFFETISDHIKNVHLIKSVHGIENVYLHRHHDNGDSEGYGIKYKKLPSTMKRLFPKGTVFGVKGAEQKRMLERILLVNNNDDQQQQQDDDENFTILDIEEVFGYRMKIDTYLHIAPTLHKDYHVNLFENACAAKIAFNYAEFLRDRMKFGEIPQSIKYNYGNATNLGEIIPENDQQQHVVNDDIQENNFPGSSASCSSSNQREEDDEIQIINSKQSHCSIPIQQ